MQRISISVRQEFRFWDEAQERATITDWAGYLSVDWCFNRMLFVAHLEEVSYCIVQVLSFWLLVTESRLTLNGRQGGDTLAEARPYGAARLQLFGHWSFPSSLGSS